MAIDWESLVPYMENDEIERRAEHFLNQYWDQKTPKIPIDLIVERDLGIDIESKIDLQRLSIDSCLSKDMKTIYISKRSWDVEVRYRFSVAHECSHFLLHKNVIEIADFQNFEEWCTFYESIPEKTKKRLDLQADSMAGKILIPKKLASKAIDNALEEMKFQFEEAKIHILELSAETEKMFAQIVGTKIAPLFDVSWEAAKWRIYWSQELMDKIKDFLF